MNLKEIKEKIKKGDVLFVEYRKNIEDLLIESSGILFGISEFEIILVHNFSNNKPIDTTHIPIDRILNIKKIKPKEINSTKDLE